MEHLKSVGRSVGRFVNASYHITQDMFNEAPGVRLYNAVDLEWVEMVRWLCYRYSNDFEVINNYGGEPPLNLAIKKALELARKKATMANIKKTGEPIDDSDEEKKLLEIKEKNLLKIIKLLLKTKKVETGIFERRTKVPLEIFLKYDKNFDYDISKEIAGLLVEKNPNTRIPGGFYERERDCRAGLTFLANTLNFKPNIAKEIRGGGIKTTRRSQSKRKRKTKKIRNKSE
jgi:hypothetical protein